MINKIAYYRGLQRFLKTYKSLFNLAFKMYIIYLRYLKRGGVNSCLLQINGC